MAMKWKEDKWNLGMSQDPFIGYKGQFQYSRNINIRDMENGLALSSKSEETTIMNTYTYVPCDHSFLIKAERGGFKRVFKQSNGSRPASSLLIGELGGSTTDVGLKFQDMIWMMKSNSSDIYRFDCSTGQGTLMPITTPTWTDSNTGTVYTYSGADSVLNFANSVLLIGDGNRLWRYVPIAKPGLPIGWKVVREFEEGAVIEALTMEGNYLKIYTNNNNRSTKIHYAKGTFDVEDSGLVQTVTIDNMRLESVTSDGVSDYVLFRKSIDNTEFILYEMRGYDKVEIFRSNNPDPDSMDYFLGMPGDNMIFTGGSLYVPMDDGIRSFKKIKGIRSGKLEWTHSNYLDEFPSQIVAQGDYLYYTVQKGFGGDYLEKRMSTQWRPPTYQPTGFLIGRIYKGESMVEGKTNQLFRIGYLLPDVVGYDGYIKVRIRRDRESRNFGSFYTIKNIEDANRMYADIFPTSDKDVRKNWNVLEYEIELVRGTDETVTPRFYEFNCIYDYTRRIKQ